MGENHRLNHKKERDRLLSHSLLVLKKNIKI